MKLEIPPAQRSEITQLTNIKIKEGRLEALTEECITEP